MTATRPRFVVGGGLLCWLLVAGWVVADGPPAAAQSRSCGRCGASLPSGAGVGSACPRCGVTFRRVKTSRPTDLGTVVLAIAIMVAVVFLAECAQAFLGAVCLLFTNHRPYETMGATERRYHERLARRLGRRGPDARAEHAKHLAQERLEAQRTGHVPQGVEPTTDAEADHQPRYLRE